MVFRMELTISEGEELLDTKYIPTSSTWYTPPPRNYKNSDVNLMLKSLLPDDMKLNNTIDDVG